MKPTTPSTTNATSAAPAARPTHGVFRLYFEEARKARPQVVGAHLPAGAKAPGALRPASATTAASAVSVGRLAEVRASHEATSQQLVLTRQSHHVQAAQLDADRAVDAICTDLVAEFSKSETPGATATPAPSETPWVVDASRVTEGVNAAASSDPTPRYTAEQRAHHALALIEKIEVFMKSSRPAMALTLDNSLGATVEIERLGPRQIALRLVSRAGLPTPESLSLLREELRARGLNVAALSVG